MAKETVICTYRVRPDAENQFAELLRRHWDALHDLGFVTDERSQVLRDVDGPTYIEIFTWVEGGFGRASQHPDVLGLWDSMEPLLEDRDGRPKWEFPHYLPADLARG